ncbi:spore maturation protein [Fodinisporobacter ferrooxydans]|uniref:Spore maturation protein n=1 Tax=Fodinisporobacter ferrooxydans TaxID=2901836 RepID=A0ABY4CHH7_9BACL|nr:spore maturation protein [Alicyclobacillaceae bacterium MYW30-H2]
MMNVIWLVMLVSGVVVAGVQGNIDKVTTAVLHGARDGVDVCFGLISILVFWLGMMKIAEQAGLVEVLAKWLRPIARFLYPSVPVDHPAMGSILANMSANILGLGNAATPLGLKAMKQLQDLNPNKDEASDAMCTLLAINTASITLIPATVLGLRVQYGSHEPASIIVSTILATCVATILAIFLDRYFRKRARRKKAKR